MDVFILTLKFNPNVFRKNKIYLFIFPLIVFVEFPVLKQIVNFYRIYIFYVI